jgi:DNA-binding NarL/FixJ family response regulator
MLTLLLVDDHPLFHEGLASALARHAPDWRIVSAGSAEAGVRQLEQDPSIALALIDWMLPGGDGMSAMRLYGAAFPQVPRVLISGREDASVAARVRAAGASGFIPKSLPVMDMIDAIRTILEGGTFFPSVAEPAPCAPMPDGEHLTLRQLEVLALLCRGHSNKEIARELSIADRTVRAHITEVFAALGVASRTQAIIEAQRLGLLTLA